MAKEIETINPIIVTGNYYPKKLTETGSSVTVISKKEIRKKWNAVRFTNTNCYCRFSSL